MAVTQLDLHPQRGEAPEPRL